MVQYCRRTFSPTFQDNVTLEQRYSNCHTRFKTMPWTTCLAQGTKLIYVTFCSGQTNDDTIKTSDTVLRKIYLSLYLKGLCVRGSWRPNRTVTYWPPLLWPSVFLSHSLGLLNRGPSLSGCWFSLPHHLSNWSGLQTDWLTVFTELYNSSTPTFFLWASQFCTHSTCPRSRL